MKERIDHTGKQYYNWTVLNFVGTSNSNKNAIWKCRCSCGKEKNVRIAQALCGHSKQCGSCGAKETYNEVIPAAIWNIIGRHTGRGNSRVIKMLLTKEEATMLYEKQDRKCALSGLSIIFPKNNREYRAKVQTASLDRIDSSKDYEVNNVQWVHKIVNTMKMHFSQEEFIKMCKLIALNN